MLKKQARKEYRRMRDALEERDRMKWDDLLLIQFQSFQLPFLQNVLSFYPIEEKKEINTFLITDYLHFRNPQLQLAYPRTDVTTHSMLAVHCLADTIFEENEYNIPEPVHGDVLAPDVFDLVLVPMLICDKQGHRVGYGKGFYDRFLAQCRPDAIKIGFSYFEPIDRVEDAGEFDVPLNICITPQKVYAF